LTGTPVYTVSRVRNIVTANLAAVRTGESNLADAEARIMGALSGYEAQQRAAAALRDAEVTENTPGKTTSDPALTSAHAARTVAPRTGNQRGRVLIDLVEHGGATDFELVRRLSMLDNSARPRRRELVEGGYVRASGLIREHFGTAWTVWEATTEGRAWYRRASGGAA
jgi:hypothetical protein